MNLIKDFLGYVLFIVLLPAIILAVIVGTVLTAFEGKSKDGKSKKIAPSCFCRYWCIDSYDTSIFDGWTLSYLGNSLGLLCLWRNIAYRASIVNFSWNNSSCCWKCFYDNWIFEKLIHRIRYDQIYCRRATEVYKNKFNRV